MSVDVLVIAKTVATMFMLVIIGYAAVKLGWLKDNIIRGLSDFVIKVATPFLIVKSTLSIPFSQDKLISGFQIMGISIVLHIIAGAIAYFAAKPMKDNVTRKISEFCVVFPNGGFMGVPLLGAVFGDIGVFWTSFFIVAFNIVTWTYGIFILSRANSDIKMNPMKILVNFGTIPCALGVLLYSIQVPIPGIVTDVMSYMGNLCTPLAMIIIGALLARIPFRSILNRPKSYYICAIRLFAVPLVIAVLAKLIGLPYELAIFSVIIMALPTATNACTFSESYDIESEYAATVVGLSTLFSVGTVPLVAWIAGMILK